MDDSHSNNHSEIKSDQHPNLTEQFTGIKEGMILETKEYKEKNSLPSFPQQPQSFVQPEIMNPPQQIITAQGEIENTDQFFFWENANSIMVAIEKTTQVGKVNSQNVSQHQYHSKVKDKVYTLTYFRICCITKCVYEGLENDQTTFKIECVYWDKAKASMEPLEIEFNEELLTNHQLVQHIKKAFGSKHVPFPAINRGIDTNELLVEYILREYSKDPKEERIDCYSLNLKDTDGLSDPERKAIVQNFYQIYRFLNMQSKLLLTWGFGTLCLEDLLALPLNIIPVLNKVIIIYGCHDTEQQESAAAWASVSSDIIDIKRLSEIKVTSKQDELKTMFFHSRDQVVFFEDDDLNDYSRKQNRMKIHRISEHVCNGLFRENKETIDCAAVIFTRRKLIEFKDIAKECIFINAAGLSPADWKCQDIIADFISLLYDNIGYYFEHQKNDLISHLLRTTYSRDTNQIEIVYEIYTYLVNAMFETYGIAESSESKQSASQTQTVKSTSRITAFLIQSHLLLKEKTICDRFVRQINQFIQAERVTVRLYDRNLSVSDQALLYEHQGEPLLLFSNSYFDELFASSVVENKDLIRILNEGGHLFINYLDKQCFRMPIDERKLYTAVKLSALEEETVSRLPELHPVIVPDVNDGIARINIGSDKYGRKIYWPIGKLENRSVLVQGNTRTGKTYFVTTRLLTGLHELGYRIIVFDSEASSYNRYELSKCKYDEAFIAEHFCHGQAETAEEIMKEFVSSLDKIYIVNNQIDDNEKIKLCKLLFDYQKRIFAENEKDTPPLFIVFEEAGDNSKSQDIPVYDTDSVKRLYNQGSKLRLSVITILQMFIGKGSRNFQRMVAQSGLKVAFKCSTDHIKYFIETIPPKFREYAKNRLPILDVGEAFISGDFEDSDGTLHAHCFLVNSKAASPLLKK